MWIYELTVKSKRPQYIFLNPFSTEYFQIIMWNQNLILIFLENSLSCLKGLYIYIHDFACEQIWAGNLLFVVLNE